MALGLALLQAFWFFLPAFVANPLAVVFGGGRPMDGGRVGRDGRRLLGDGKTWRGLFGGALASSAVGGVLWAIGIVAVPELSFGPFPQGALPILALAFGALLGDVGGSYAKRRMGRKRGARTPGLDWYDFVLGAFLVLALVDLSFFLDHYVLGEAIAGLALIIVITPFLHRAVNLLGYRLGKKDVPW